MSKGLFIAIYGVNNIGKSTHARLLVESLKRAGKKVFYLKYPVYDLEPTGPAINAILRSGGKQSVGEDELQRLFMQNRRDFEPELKKIINDGFVVVAEDYTGTGIAWGTAKGLELSFMEKLNDGLLKEDMAILITGKRDIRAMEKKHIHERNGALVENVVKILEKLADRYGWVKVPLQPKIVDTAKLIREAIESKAGL
jgi:thymidylate kinase